jgi:hypothetical protein
MSKNKELELVEYDIVSHGFMEQYNCYVSTGYLKDSNDKLQYFRMILYWEWNHKEESFINWNSTKISNNIRGKRKINSWIYEDGFLYGYFENGKYFEMDTSLHKIRWEVGK